MESEKGVWVPLNPAGAILAHGVVLESDGARSPEPRGDCRAVVMLDKRAPLEHPVSGRLAGCYADAHGVPISGIAVCQYVVRPRRRPGFAHGGPGTHGEQKVQLSGPDAPFPTCAYRHCISGVWGTCFHS